MDSAPAATTTSTLDPLAFDWSEDVATIPITPMFPKNQPCHNLSALCTPNPNPFSSLAHQNHYSWLSWERVTFLGPSHHFGHVEPNHSSLSHKLFLVITSFWSWTPPHHHYHQPCWRFLWLLIGNPIHVSLDIEGTWLDLSFILLMFLLHPLPHFHSSFYLILYFYSTIFS